MIKIFAYAYPVDDVICLIKSETEDQRNWLMQLLTVAQLEPYHSPYTDEMDDFCISSSTVYPLSNILEFVQSVLNLHKIEYEVIYDE